MVIPTITFAKSSSVSDYADPSFRIISEKLSRALSSIAWGEPARPAVVYFNSGHVAMQVQIVKNR
jgi:hypothetical protein